MYVYIYIYIYICMCIYGHRPYMDLPRGQLRDIATGMLRYVDIYI